MGGYSPSGNSGSSDAPAKKRSTVTKTRGQGGIVDFISKGGVTGMVVRGIAAGVGKAKENYKTNKANNVAIGTSDYQGSKSKSSVNGFGDRNNDGPSDARTGKSIEQPKVKSQMDNSLVKSDLISAQGPTDIEMDNSNLTTEELALARKRGRKTKTILTSVTGDNTKATLSKKVLLG